MRVLLAAGGTGGHVIPALTVARVLTRRLPACSCLAVSSGRGVVAQVWDPAVGALATVPVAPWPQGRQVLDPRYWWRQAGAAGRLQQLVRRYRPQVVVGFGGAVSGPTVIVAKLRGVPAVIHEQNVLPGRATRWLAAWADRIAVSFEETRQHLPARAPVLVTGNPVRPEVEGALAGAAALAALRLASGTPVLLIMGGSQGAHAVNAVSVEAMARLPVPRRRMIQLLHLTGARDLAWVTARYRALGVAARVQAFLPTMGLAYAAATAAVARAGATTVAELVATATPAVLIPYPHAGAHQAVNAAWLGRRGGALVLEQAALTPDRFLEAVWPLLTDGARLAAMRAALRRVATPGAAERVADAVLEVARAA